MTGFEKTYLEIQRLGIEYAFENLPELEEQLKEYKQLCIMKARLEELSTFWKEHDYQWEAKHIVDKIIDEINLTVETDSEGKN